MKKCVAAVGRLRDRAVVRFSLVKNFLKAKQEGASMVEYAILVALIALVCIAAITLVGTALNTVFNNIQNKLNNL